jgi:sterol desaturase/sphingolipid hydroxylase (fatty acid hydroxylase superfamily)
MPFVNSLLEHLELITQGCLAAGLAAFTWLEMQAPRVPSPRDRWSRWQTNVVLYVLTAVLMAAAFAPLSGQAIQWASLTGWGGLAATDWPTPVKVGLGVLLMDLYQYLLHVGAHYVPWWWRLHKIHHSDTSMDASTSVRHHPLEVLVNGFVLVLMLAFSGVPIYSILLYTFVQLLHGLFCHANLALPQRVDRWLRWFVVTPDMHAVHHSIQLDEGNSNFGMVFPWWDRVFRSYCAQPQQGRLGMRLGIAELGGRSGLGVLGLLGLAFSATHAQPATPAAGASSQRKRRQR